MYFVIKKLDMPAFIPYTITMLLFMIAFIKQTIVLLLGGQVFTTVKFGNSVKFGNDVRMPSGKRRVTSLSVVAMTTANGKQLTFSRRHVKFLLIIKSIDLYRVNTKFTEMRSDLARRFLNSIRPT